MARIQSIDAMRGVCVILMVIHHFLSDLVDFLGAPPWVFTNPVLDVLHFIFAGCFIMLSGVSSRFSRSNVRRGIKVGLIALLLTLVTWYIDMIILFGVLHFLSFCMIFYGLTRKLWDKLPLKSAPVLYIALLVISAVAVHKLDSTNTITWLWPLGLTHPDFYSADYFPIFPWIFVFLLGTWLGDIIRKGLLPGRFYTFSVPFFPAVGRKALLIYVVHQPVLYAIILGIGHLAGIHISV